LGFSFKESMMKLFYVFIFIFSTALFGVDKTYKASSGNLILDASTKVIAKPDVDIGDSSVVGNRYFTVKADAANRPYLQLNSGSNTIQHSIGSTADISSPQVELHMSVLGSDNTLVLEGGEVGINTPNPTEALHVVGSAYITTKVKSDNGFYTYSGTYSSAASGAWVNLQVLPSIYTAYIVHVYVVGGNATAYSATATVMSNGASMRMANKDAGSLLDIRIIGQTLQATQGSGGNANISYALIRIGE